MNFLFDGRMEVDDLPDEICRVTALLKRATVSHLFQVTLQCHLLSEDIPLHVRTERGTTRDIVYVRPLIDLATRENFRDAFEDEKLEVVAGVPLSLRQAIHSVRMRQFTGPDRGPPTLTQLRKILHPRTEGRKRPHRNID